MGLSTTLKIAFDAKRVQRGLAGIRNGFKSIVSAGAKLAATAAVFAGITAAAAAAVISINSIGETARASDARLQNIVKSMGIFGEKSEEVGDRLLDLADAQARLTGVDDDVIAGTQSKLLTFAELAKTADQLGGNFDRATMAALDMAAAGFGTAEGNAVQLGKALNDPMNGLKALTKSGITFTDKQKLQITTFQVLGKMGKAQAEVLKAIETQVQGTAAATATSSGKMKASMGQLMEAFAKPFSKGFDLLPGKMEASFDSLKAKMTAAGELVGKAISEAVQGDTSRLAQIGDFVARSIIAGMDAAFHTLGTAAMQGWADKMSMGGMNPIAGKISKSIGESRLSAPAQMSESLRKYGVAESMNKIKSYDPAANSENWKKGWERTDGVMPKKGDDKSVDYLKVIATNTASGAKM